MAARSCRSAVTQPPSGSAERTASSSAGEAVVVSTTSPDSTSRASKPLSSNADQSAAPSSESARTISPSIWKTRPSGSRNDPPSGVDALLVDGLVAPKAHEPLRAAPVHLAHHDDAGNAGHEPLDEQAARAGIEIRKQAIHG